MTTLVVYAVLAVALGVVFFQMQKPAVSLPVRKSSQSNSPPLPVQQKKVVKAQATETGTRQRAASENEWLVNANLP